MIFVTVGHQMPFDRLVRAVDHWAYQHDRQDVFAQIGEGSYEPQHFEWTRFMAPREFQHRIADAEAVIAHAGTGTIIAAVQLGKPLLVLPRLSALGETRNDHQVATARRFVDAGYVMAATSEVDLVPMIDQLETFRATSTISDSAKPELLQRLRTFVSEAA